MQSELERCIAEQRACALYLQGDGLDREGAWTGLQDWLCEECLIRLEENRPEPRDSALE